MFKVRSLPSGLLLVMIGLLCACRATGPLGEQPASLGGSYRFDFDYNAYYELDLQPDGGCTFSECQLAGGGIAWSGEGAWTRSGDQLRVLVEPPATHWWPRERLLSVRRLGGSTYLVPPMHLSEFDAHGPVHDVCFALQHAEEMQCTSGTQ